VQEKEFSSHSFEIAKPLSHIYTDRRDRELTACFPMENNGESSKQNSTCATIATTPIKPKTSMSDMSSNIGEITLNTGPFMRCVMRRYT